MSKPRIWYLPSPSHTEKIFSKETYKAFRDNFDVEVNNLETASTPSEVEENISRFDGLVTGWGVAPFTKTALERADKLKIIVHSAGSVKYLFNSEMITKQIVPKRIRIFSANHSIALNVAEHTVGSLIMMSRRWFHHALNIRNRKMWQDSELTKTCQHLRGSVVGIVSASAVGKEVIRLLKSFNVQILIYDPYLDEQEASKLNVERVDLKRLFKNSDMVTIHAPSTPETEGLIGSEQLRLLKDDAVLINTSRGSVLDSDALYEVAKLGRIQVHLDVTYPEPLPEDHVLRSLPNVVITPHISARGKYGMHKIGETSLTALIKFFEGIDPIPGQIDLSKWSYLA
tara:strand:- start:5312 stop:6337 length:1026 start_codon:yes stop_codon:yes gene_type:complete